MKKVFRAVKERKIKSPTKKDKSKPAAQKNSKDKKKKEKSKQEKTRTRDFSDSDSSASESVKSKRAPSMILPVVDDSKPPPGAPNRPIWEDALLKLLAEDRPDLEFDKAQPLQKAEALLFDKMLRDLAKLKPGDILYSETNHNEDDPRYTRFLIKRLYNTGRYGAAYVAAKEVCKGEKSDVSKTPVIVKCPLRSNSYRTNVCIKRELKVLKDLQSLKKVVAPKLIGQGSVIGNKFIVLTAYDRNLDRLRQDLGGNFSRETVAYIGSKTLICLQAMHSLSYIHRDVKPSNFVIGLGSQSAKIYIIDFGETVKPSKKMKLGIPDQDTLPYWSLGAHKKEGANYRMDIESWLYMLLEFALLGLPWKAIEDEKASREAKEKFWTEGNLTAYPHLEKIKRILSESKDINANHYTEFTKILEEVVGGGRPDWAPEPTPARTPKQPSIYSNPTPRKKKSRKTKQEKSTRLA